MERDEQRLPVLDDSFLRWVSRETGLGRQASSPPPNVPSFFVESQPLLDSPRRAAPTYVQQLRRLRELREAGGMRAAPAQDHVGFVRAGSEEAPCPSWPGAGMDDEIMSDSEPDDDGQDLIDLIMSGTRTSEDLGRLLRLQRRSVPSGPVPLPAPLEPVQSCSYLAPGITFSGCQRLLGSSSRHSDNWRLSVTIHSVDMSSACVTGTMDALNVPASSQPIITLWEGEIIDNIRHSFYTCKWNATQNTDLLHWSRLKGFDAIRSEVVKYGGKSPSLHQQPYIFMRWKELSFVTAPGNCSLSITGFYYVSLSRVDGSIQGFYYDVNTTPFQELSLELQKSGNGMAFGSYTFR